VSEMWKTSNEKSVIGMLSIFMCFLLLKVISIMQRYAGYLEVLQYHKLM